MANACNYNVTNCGTSMVDTFTIVDEWMANPMHDSRDG